MRFFAADFIVLQTLLLFQSLTAPESGSNFAAHFRHQRETVEELIKPNASSSSSSVSSIKLTVALRKIIDRLNDAEHSRIRTPLNHTISEIERLITANASLSVNRKVAYIGYMLRNLVMECQWNDNNGIIFEKINEWGFLYDFILLRHAVNLEVAVKMMLKNTTTGQSLFYKALNKTISHVSAKITKLDSLELGSVSKSVDVDTMPSAMEELISLRPLFHEIRRRTKEAELEEIEDFGPLQFLMDAVDFAYFATHIEHHVYFRARTLLLYLKICEYTVNESILPQKTKKKFAEFVWTMKFYYEMHNKPSARIKKFVQKMWMLFTFSGQQNNTVFRYMDRNIYHVLHLAVFRENWNLENFTTPEDSFSITEHLLFEPKQLL